MSKFNSGFCKAGFLLGPFAIMNREFPPKIYIFQFSKNDISHPCIPHTNYPFLSLLILRIGGSLAFPYVPEVERPLGVGGLFVAAFIKTQILQLQLMHFLNWRSFFITISLTTWYSSRKAMHRVGYRRSVSPGEVTCVSGFSGDVSLPLSLFARSGWMEPHWLHGAQSSSGNTAGIAQRTPWEVCCFLYFYALVEDSKIPVVIFWFRKMMST